MKNLFKVTYSEFNENGFSFQNNEKLNIWTGIFSSKQDAQKDLSFEVKRFLDFYKITEYNGYINEEEFYITYNNQIFKGYISRDEI